MAIREVLVSFTFEQQRQMINLIGTDIGDASTLLTPTNVVVPAINEIVNGDVDLVNQTHGMDDGTQSSPSLYWNAGQGFYKVDANKIGLTTGLAVEGNLEVDGDITFRAGAGSGGTLTFGDLDTDNIVLNADVNSSIIPDSDQSWNIGTALKQWNDLYITGTAYIDTLQIDENATMTGHLTMESGDIRVPSTQTTVSLFNSYATTVNAFGGATSLNMGPTGAGGADLMLRFTNIYCGRTTLGLFNQNVETLNAFGAATTINMGVAGSLGVNTNFNVASDDFVLSGDLSVNGGEILSSQNTVDLFITQGDVRIGAVAGSGTTTVQNTLKVQTNIDVTNSSTDFLIKDNESSALTVKEGSNEYVKFTTTNADEKILIYKDVYVIGNLDITGTTTTIGTANLQVDDKNIELAVSSVPSDTLADGGGITLKATTDKTITYNNTSGCWETNIGLKVTGDIETSQNLLIKGTDNNGLFIRNGANSAWTTEIKGNGNATFAGTVTSNGITQYTLPTMTNGGQIGYDDASKSLRLYSNSSTSSNATVQFHFNQSGTAGIIFNQYEGGSLRFMGQTATAATGSSTSESYLSHYEEGTWTPDFYGLSSAFSSYSNKVGTFIRIGSWCHINGFIQLTAQPSFTTATDFLRLGPLPFYQSNQNGGYYATVGGVSCQNFNFHDNDYSNTGQLACGVQDISGTSYVVFTVSGNNNTRGTVKNSAISTNDIIEFSLSYRV